MMNGAMELYGIALPKVGTGESTSHVGKGASASAARRRGGRPSSEARACDSVSGVTIEPPRPQGLPRPTHRRSRIHVLALHVGIRHHCRHRDVSTDGWTHVSFRIALSSKTSLTVDLGLDTCHRP